jgi:general secretion pathway protein G
MLAVSLLVLVIASSLIFTKWLALAVILVVFSARRAVRLARENPDWYGGYRVASATLSVTVLASIGAGVFAIAYIPRYLENRATREAAATRAEMHRIASILEDFKLTHESYPENAQELKIILNESLPSDYWEKSIKYQSYTLDIASNQSTLPLGSAVIPVNYNFELKSAGPDGKDDTDDDIIMRDGVFLTAAEARTQAVPRNAPPR